MTGAIVLGCMVNTGSASGQSNTKYTGDFRDVCILHREEEGGN